MEILYFDRGGHFEVWLEQIVDENGYGRAKVTLAADNESYQG